MNLVRHELVQPPQADAARVPGLTCQLKVAKAFSPFFVVDDPAATALGCAGSIQHRCVRPQGAGRTSPPGSAACRRWTTACWATSSTDAGAHLYGPPGDVIHAGGGILCVHTARGGERDLLLKNGRRLRVQLAPRSTQHLRRRKRSRPYRLTRSGKHCP